MDYKQKYLKYKLKYLKLQQIQSGGMPDKYGKLTLEEERKLRASEKAKYLGTDTLGQLSDILPPTKEDENIAEKRAAEALRRGRELERQKKQEAQNPVAPPKTEAQKMLEKIRKKREERNKNPNSGSGAAGAGSGSGAAGAGSGAVVEEDSSSSSNAAGANEEKTWGETAADAVG